MPSTKAQCQFCNQTFSKRSHLYRHWTLNRCSSNPNPLHKRVRCSHCDGEFASTESSAPHNSKPMPWISATNATAIAHTSAARSTTTTKITAITTIAIHGTSAANWMVEWVHEGQRTAIPESGAGDLDNNQRRTNTPACCGWRKRHRRRSRWATADNTIEAIGLA